MSPALHSAPPPAAIDPVVVNAVLIAVRQAANLLCDRWTLQLLLAAHAGVTRFADFRENSGAANRLLTSRLQHLVEQEVLVRLAYSRRPLRHGYHLTHMGLALFDVLAAMQRWEQDGPSADAANGTGLQLQHSACGLGDVHPLLHCAACGGTVTARDVDLGLMQKQMGAMPSKATAHRRSGATTDAAGSGAAPPLPQVLNVFGDKWSIEVLMCAFVRVTTFSGFQSHTGMATNIVADRLARLVAAGILQQVQAEAGQRRGSYRLTERGIALFPVLVQIEAWADTWMRDRVRSPMRLMHRACGQPLKLTVACNGCGQALKREDSVLRLGR